MKRVILLLCAVLLPLSFAKAQSIVMQGFPPPGGGPDGPMIFAHPPDESGQVISRGGEGDMQIRRQLEQIKIWQMTKEMDLPTDKAERFFPLYNKYNDQIGDITTKRREYLQRLDSTVTSGATDGEVRRQVNGILALDNKLAEAHTGFIKSLQGILSPMEVAKYMVFEQRFDREIRDRVRVIMQQRMRGRGGR